MLLQIWKLRKVGKFSVGLERNGSTVDLKKNLAVDAWSVSVKHHFKWQSLWKHVQFIRLFVQKSQICLQNVCHWVSFEIFFFFPHKFEKIFFFYWKKLKCELLNHLVASKSISCNTVPYYNTLQLQTRISENIHQ